MKLLPRVTYANVVATLALFIALGGAAWATMKLPKNSVGARQLKRSAVVTAKIKNEAVTSAKIRKGTIGGSRLNLTSLGTVPSARTATNAQTLDGAGASTYLGRVAQAAADGINLHLSTPAVTDATPGGPLAITVPAGVGFVVADAAASFADAPVTGTDTELWVQEDEPCAKKGFGWDNEAYGSLAATTSRDEVTQHLAFPVGAGAHSYRLCLLAGGSADVFSRTLTLATVPRGAGG